MIKKLMCSYSLRHLLRSKHSYLTRQVLCNFHSSQKNSAQCRKVVQPAPGPIICQRLQHRAVVRAAGADCAAFFQGLVTNDMRCLEGSDNTCNVSGAPAADCAITALYTMMLNLQGRVMYDLIMYKPDPSPDDKTFLIECDKTVVEEFIKTVKKYKIRKKVDIVDVSDEMSVWAAFPQTYTEISPEALDLTIIDSPNLQVAAPDPRLRSFGHRLVLHDGVSGDSVVESSSLATSDTDYHSYRYQAGIGEGIIDLPVGKAIPLEANIVFLNGINFNKGCYIGQELTARTFHTGVTRKRLMPVNIHSNPDVVQPGDTLYNDLSKTCGKMRGSAGSFGLALLRLNTSVAEELTIRSESDGRTASIKAFIPGWWHHNCDDIVKQTFTKFEEQTS